MSNSHDDTWVFEGFWHPEEQQGYTQLPHELIDLMSDMSDSELRIVLYLFRHTWGFQEFDVLKKLTTDEFMHGRKRRDGTRLDNGTGLSDRGVKNGLIDATKHGYIIQETDDSDKGRIRKYYKIKIFHKQETK